MSTENEYQPINCDDYDNLELACQNHMVLEVTLQGGDVLTGKATDLVLRKKWSTSLSVLTTNCASFVWTRLSVTIIPTWEQWLLITHRPESIHNPASGVVFCPHDI